MRQGKQNPLQNRVVRLLPAVLGVALLGILLWQIGWSSLSEILTANPYWILAAVVLVFINLLFRGWKWNQILSFYGHRIPSWNATQIFCQGTVIGFFTPLKIGIFFRALQLKSLTKTKAVASILVDRFSDIGLVLFISCVTLLGWGADQFEIPFLQNHFILAGIGIAGILLFLLGLKALEIFSNPIRQLLERLLPFGKIGTNAAEALHQTGQFGSEPSRFVGLFLASLCSFATAVLYYAAMAAAFGIAIPLPDFIGMIGLTFLIETMPITALGIGTREAAWILAGPQLGITPGQALILPLSATLVNYAVLTAVSFTRQGPAEAGKS